MNPAFSSTRADAGFQPKTCAYSAVDVHVGETPGGHGLHGHGRDPFPPVFLADPVAEFGTPSHEVRLTVESDTADRFFGGAMAKFISGWSAMTSRIQA